VNFSDVAREVGVSRQWVSQLSAKRGFTPEQALAYLKKLAADRPGRGRRKATDEQVLEHLGKQPSTAWALADALVISRATAYRMLERLCAAGRIERKVPEQVGRGHRAVVYSAVLKWDPT
jgi:DNA-binding MarR family transcriptional regulator